MTHALQLVQVRLRRGSRDVLRGVDLSVSRGDIVALMGPSGSGKTTVLRVIAGLETFDAGEVRIGDLALVGGRPQSARDMRDLYRAVGMVFQFHHLFEHLSALDNVTLAPERVQGVAAEHARRRALDLLTALGVDHRARAYPRELSGGEAQRVAIARALAVEPRVLLMDEPTASLDPARRAELAQLLTGLRRDRTLVVSTHDEEFARACATRIVRLEAGVAVG